MLRSLRRALALICLGAGFSACVGTALAQIGPNATGSATVARPRPKPQSADPSADSPAASRPADDRADNDEDLAPIPSKLSRKATRERDEPTDVTFAAEATNVTVDVAVLDNKGNPIPDIDQDKFRILEDNVPQKITDFQVSGEAPMTIALVIEFSARFQQIYSRGWFETLQTVYTFFQALKPEDYVSVIAYDIRSTLLTDFTNDRAKLQGAISRLTMPGFSESNMFDALADTADRMSKLEGRKAILYIGSGIDTFSKLTYDKTRRSLQESGVPVYAIGTLQAMRGMAEASGQLGAISGLDFIQGDNELRTFARETGGQAFFPTFAQELGQVFQSLTRSLRTEYTITYTPANQAHDGKFRRISVQLIDPKTGEALRLVDEKRKPMKYSIVATSGYTAPGGAVQ